MLLRPCRKGFTLSAVSGLLAGIDLGFVLEAQTAGLPRVARHGGGCIGGAAHPALDSEHYGLESDVEIGGTRRIRGPVSPNLSQQATEAEVETDLQILAEVLCAEDRRAAPVARIRLGEHLDLAHVEPGRGSARPVAEEVRHVCAGERRHRIDIDRVRVE